MIDEVSEKTYELINNYFNLKIGNKLVKCPYYLNPKHKRGELRSLIGKGTPSEIEDEVRIWSKIKKFDLNTANTYEIRKFMIDHAIGVDCSGFVSHILDTEIRFKNQKIRRIIDNSEGKDIFRKIYHRIRFLDNLDVQTLTSSINCKKIENLDEIKPLDLLRLRGLQEGFHIAIVIKTCYNEGNKVITYAHSSRWYLPNDGVRIGNIIITNPDNDLSHQIWNDSDHGSLNYIRQEYVNNKKEAYFCRLKKLI